MFKTLMPALALLAVSILLSLFATLRVTKDSQQLAVLYPFGNSFLQNAALVLNTGAPIIREGAGDSILIVKRTSSNTEKLLYSNGALLVFDPQILGNCTAKTPSASLPVQHSS